VGAGAGARGGRGRVTEAPPRQGRAPTTEELLEDAPATLRTLFDRLGATYIKLGQFVASSPTLFPAAYVEEFQKCLDDTEPVPFSAIQRTIRAELGRDPAAVYEYIDPAPLATASIAQVHAAKLKSGEDVVIKVDARPLLLRNRFENSRQILDSLSSPALCSMPGVRVVFLQIF